MSFQNRMWRKTRVPYSGCFGADPNRNWGHFWNSGGASASPCAETYSGPSAFSEPSTRSLSEFIATIANRLVAYISFHSFSQMLLIPYGYTTAHLDNYNVTVSKTSYICHIYFLSILISACYWSQSDSVTGKALWNPIRRWKCCRNYL